MINDIEYIYQSLNLGPIELLLIMLLLNFGIVAKYQQNIVFPVLFILFELIFAIAIISINAIYVGFLLILGICFNFFMILNNRKGV